MIIIRPLIVTRALERLLDQAFLLRLFINDTARAGDEPIQPPAGGYEEKVLRLEDWQISLLALRGQAMSGPHAFVFDGSLRMDILGAYMVESATGYIHWVDVFEDPFQVRRAGDTLLVTARIGLGAL